MNIQQVNAGIEAYDKNVRFKSHATEGEGPQAVESSANTRELNKGEVKDLVNALNEYVSGINQRISFSIDENTQRVVVRIINRNTNEVVREVPSKEAVRLLEHLQDFVGMLVDESR